MKQWKCGLEKSDPSLKLKLDPVAVNAQRSLSQDQFKSNIIKVKVLDRRGPTPRKPHFKDVKIGVYGSSSLDGRSGCDNEALVSVFGFGTY